MGIGPQFYIYQCRSNESSYTQIATVSNTNDLQDELNELDGRGILVIFSEDQPRDLLVRRIKPLRHQMLMCPATDVLLRQNPANTHVRGNTIHFVQLAPGERGPDRLFPWFHATTTEAVGGGEDPRDNISMQACSDPDKAFLYNVMNDPDMRETLTELEIYTWGDFYQHYHKLDLQHALWIASRVKASLNRWAYMACEQKTSNQYIAEIAIRVASAVAPWQAQEPPTSDVRTMNALMAGDVRTIGGVSKCNPTKLTKLPNFGPRSLTMLLNTLLEFRVDPELHSETVAV